MVSGEADLLFFGEEMRQARISKADGGVLVPTSKAASNIAKGGAASNVANQVLNAAKEEGKQYAILKDLEESGASADEIAVQRQAVQDARQ